MKELQLKLTVEEVNVILEALGNMPFSRVHEIIFKIQNQASQQLQEAGGGAAAGAKNVDDEQ